MAEPLIAGVGFATIGERPDLSGLDRALGRIEDAGATHAELALFAADLIAGGRVRPEARRRLEAICARHRLRYTAHGVLAVNFMDEAHLDQHKQVCRASIELAAGVGASVLVQHPGLVPSRPTAELDRLHAIERDAWREMGDRGRSLRPQNRGRDTVRRKRERVHARPGAARRRDPGHRPSADHRHARRQPQLPDEQLSRRNAGRGRARLRAGDGPLPSARFVRAPARRPRTASIPTRSGWRSASATCTCRSAGATSHSSRCCPGCRCSAAACSRSSCRSGTGASWTPVPSSRAT